MNEVEILKEFHDCGAVLKGHFILTSGLHSDTYLQCARVMMDAARGDRLCKELAGKVRQVRVIIDNNPSPLVTTMSLAAGLPVDEIDLRVRIDRFTSVRAIAETDTGRLEMRSIWVNASGGCSAPPAATQGGALGQIRFRPSTDGHAVQISIRHPNNSGFQVNPVSGDFIPPHFIAHIKLSSGGRVLMEADTGISLSENPTLRLVTGEPLPAPLAVEATDLPTQSRFAATWTGAGAAAH